MMAIKKKRRLGRRVNTSFFQSKHESFLKRKGKIARLWRRINRTFNVNKRRRLFLLLDAFRKEKKTILWLREEKPRRPFRKFARRYYKCTSDEGFEGPWWFLYKLENVSFELDKEILGTAKSQNKKKRFFSNKQRFSRASFFHKLLLKIWKYRMYPHPISQILTKKFQKLWGEYLQLEKYEHSYKFSSHWFPSIWIKNLVEKSGTSQQGHFYAQHAKLQKKFRSRIVIGGYQNKRKKWQYINKGGKSQYRNKWWKQPKNKQRIIRWHKWWRFSYPLRVTKKVWWKKNYIYERWFSALKRWQFSDPIYLKLSRKVRRKRWEWQFLPKMENTTFRLKCPPKPQGWRFTFKWPQIARKLGEILFVNKYKDFGTIPARFSKFFFPKVHRPAWIRISVELKQKARLPRGIIFPLLFDRLTWLSLGRKVAITIAKALRRKKKKRRLPQLLFNKLQARFNKKHWKKWYYWKRRRSYMYRISPLKYKFAAWRYQLHPYRAVSYMRRYLWERRAQSIENRNRRKFQPRKYDNPRKQQAWETKLYYRERPYPIVNRWQFIYQRRLKYRLRNNVKLPIYHKVVKPYIKNLILQQKYLPFQPYNIHKIHWMDFRADKWFESELIPSEWNLTDESAIDSIYHNHKTISFTLYRNWPRKILHHLIRLKYAHKGVLAILRDWLADILEMDPPERFDNFHRLFSLSYRLVRALPWLPLSYFHRQLTPVQYFNFWNAQRVLYHKKRKRVYNKFTKQLYSPYEKIKFRAFRHRGGNRNFDFNRILSKVILPFFYKTFSQMRSFFNEVRTKKSKQNGRFFAFTKKFDEQLYRLGYRINVSPTIFWARCVVDNGWLYVNSIATNNNTKVFQSTLSIEKRFPFFAINKAYINIVEMSNKFTNVPSRLPENKVLPYSVVNINPSIRLLIKQIFSKNFKWGRRVLPSYSETNRQKNTVVVIKQNYVDQFATFIKDKANTKWLYFLHH